MAVGVTQVVERHKTTTDVEWRQWKQQGPTMSAILQRPHDCHRPRNQEATDHHLDPHQSHYHKVAEVPETAQGSGQVHTLNDTTLGLQC